MPHLRRHRTAWRWVSLSVLPAVAFSLVATPAPVAAWGSIYGSSTHQYIDEQAYALLAADPAYSATLFPTKAQVDAHEGVNWFGTGAWFDYLVGPGPDSEGQSSYASHYYNPTTTEGEGPKASGDQFTALVTAQGAANADAAGKGAAWAAHFMADMYVPFHVVGGYRDTVQGLYNSQGGASASSIALSADITGPIDLCYGCQIKDWSWFGADNFKTELGRYLDIATPVTTGASGNAHLDWFDPWYYNGTWPTSVKSSSHVVWEGAVSHDAGTVSGYDGRWRNAAPTFTNPGAAQRAQVEALAIAAATETRTNIVARAGSEKDGLNHAIQSAATIWRASFSALRPDLRIESGTEASTYKVTAIVDNVATELATGVRVRLAATGCEVKGAAEQPVPGSVKHDESVSWQVKADKPDACSLTLEVIGAFAQTPDLQYAKAQKPLGQPAGSLDVVFCIDVTASMQDDIDSVKAAASGIVARVAAKDPGFRVAVVAYRDWDDTEGYAMFHDFAFSSDSGTIVGNINGLTVGGGDDDPEAVLEALSRAIDSKAIGGWRTNVTKVIILMGDAPPHDPSREGLTASIVAKAAFDADPVVIETILIGNGGAFSAEAEAAFKDIAERTQGTMFRAEDSTKVVDAIGRSIEVITPPGPDNRLIAVGAGGAVLVILVLLLLARRARRRPQLAAATAGWTPGWSRPAATGWSAPVTSAGPWGAPVAPARAELMFGNPADPSTRRFPLGPSQTLGSAPVSTIVLADPQVSPQHAQVYAGGPAFAIVDLGSAGGTWVNGTRIVQPTWLRSGDMIQVGPYVLTFRS